MVTTVEDLPPGAQRAWKLKLQGKSPRRIATIIGCDIKQVYAHHAYGRKLLAGKPSGAALKRRASRRFDGTARCECGLLLPCHSCVPTAKELAESRLDRGDSSIITGRSHAGAVTR